MVCKILNTYKKSDFQNILHDPLRNKHKLSSQKKDRNRGRMCNIVILVRFADDEEFSSDISYYGDLFNAPFSPSLKNYYSEVSYSLLNINSYFYPSNKTGAVLSYKDPNPRNYYLPILIQIQMATS